MKKYYIGSTGNNPLADYSTNFYELVLKEKGYIFFDAASHHVDILSSVGSRDLVHIEIDANQPRAVHLLYLMLKTGYKHVSITLHDPLSIKLEFGKHKNPVIDTLNRVYKLISQPNAADNLLNKIKMIYVLSKTYIDPVRKRFRVDNVGYLPYVINHQEIKRRSYEDNNLVLSGREEKNREIAYFKRLHHQLKEHDANLNVYLTGLEDQQGKSRENRSFSEDLDRILFPEMNTQTDFMRKPSWTKTKTGSDVIQKIATNDDLFEQIRNDTYKYLIANHSAEAVSKIYKD